jgi:exopolyphosphatase/guanosine-5'-triphosphate,3'-diphosphate pyrophosphatase
VTTLAVEVGPRACVLRAAGVEHVLPFGPTLLTENELQSDPPRPEQLTNAIGLVADHLDDLLRTAPDVAAAGHVQVAGPEMRAIASVELGAGAVLPFVLDRAAAEDVFRTLATEPPTTRARNPGLDPDLVGTVVAGCCVLVALMRRLHLEEVLVVDAFVDALVDPSANASEAGA